MPNKAQDPASSLGLLQGAFCPLQRRSAAVLGARQAKAPQREGGEGMGDAYAKRVLLTAAGLPQLATRNLPLHFTENTTHRPAPATVFGFKLKFNATCSGLPPMSEAEAHAFEVNSFGLYNELSELVELGGADNNLNTSNVETTDYLMLPPDRELSANDYMELNDLLALDPSFSSEFSAQDNQYMQHPLAQYNGHYDLSGPSEPTMPSIFDVFPPNNGVLATDDPANYLDPAMQFPFS
ncbi:hypothetical protein Zm00014a_021492 [Zea mays]|uniref:Uncharacterized protein n=1 Tax=Zea mays TaxID=4577 RepID=A0A3L6GDY7_MAIZE|nr:hypothetical protein Zm00014a_021492 [Zea mays]